MTSAATYFVYLLRCEGGQLYAGITTDLDRRFAEHASGGGRAARYTRTHPPVRFEATWELPDRASASALEYRLKRLSHGQKEKLVSNPEIAIDLISESLARKSSAPRVLMLGNSLTTSCDLPELLAETAGADVTVHARGGARLSEHLNPKTRLGSMTHAALMAGSWTHVVLQERSDGPVRFHDAYLRATLSLCELIHGAGAVPVIYATWAYAEGCPKLTGIGMTHGEMHASLQQTFSQAVAGGNAILANAGEAFFEHEPESALYAPDGVHPSADGASLAASVIAKAVIAAK